MNRSVLSKFEQHVVCVPKRDQVLLDHVFEGRGAAEQDDGVWPGGWKAFIEHVGIDPTDSVFPLTLGLDVDCVEEVEAVWVIPRELVELILEQNIFNSAVGKEKRKLGAIITIESRLKDLVAWSDTCSTGHEADGLLCYQLP